MEAKTSLALPVYFQRRLSASASASASASSSTADSSFDAFERESLCGGYRAQTTTTTTSQRLLPVETSFEADSAEVEGEKMIKTKK